MNTPTIDDSALREASGKTGRFVGPQGIPLATPGPGDNLNVAFTSQWDNFPKEVKVPLNGRSGHIWFLVTGSTHPMQSQCYNGGILVSYANGRSERLPLHNPTTWWPIESDSNPMGSAISARIRRASISAQAGRPCSTCRWTLNESCSR
jgi:hypothetical protein